MSQFVDFVGLNTFIYEPVGWNPEEQLLIANNFQISNLEFKPLATSGFYGAGAANMGSHVLLNHIGELFLILNWQT